MLLKIYPENPADKQVQTVVEALRAGAVAIVPTDTVYAIVCDINNQKAAERLANLKGLKLEKANFSLVCKDLSDLSNFSRQVSNSVFKMMKKNLPGPFTFILNASSNVPRIFHSKKKTVGIRVPDNSIVQAIIKQLGNPLLSTSVHSDDEIREYMTDPELIFEKYEQQVDIVVDGGYGKLIASTIVDCTQDDFEIMRQGDRDLKV